jgi:hypothetical protein
MLLLLVSSCSNLLLRVVYGIKIPKEYYSEETIALNASSILKKHKQNFDYMGYIDSTTLTNMFYGKNESDSLVFSDSLNLLLQPLTALYFDSTKQLRAILMNCYAVPGSTFNSELNWNDGNRLGSFPPKSHSQNYHGKLNLDNLIRNTRFYYTSELPLVPKKIDYYVVITYCDFMGKQKDVYLDAVMGNLAKAKRTFNICTILIQKDNFVLKLSK